MIFLRCSLMHKNHRHIFSLLVWIETKLEEPLSVSIVCRKSGYSERHLQRMFKEETGLTIANYILYRRLYKSAIAIKTTHTTIDAIASRYLFQSSTSFSRAFQRLFGVSPKHFRRENKTDLSMLSRTLYLTNPGIPELQVSYEFFDGLELFGLTDTYSIPPFELDKYHVLHRASLETRFSSITKGEYNEVYSLTDYGCNDTTPDDIEISYSIGICDRNIANRFNLPPIKPVFGDYLMVTCEDISVPFFDICEKAYWEIIFKNGIKRRRGYDIEKIVWHKKTPIQKKERIDYYFLIPVILDEQLYHFLSTLRQLNTHNSTSPLP